MARTAGIRPRHWGYNASFASNRMEKFPHSYRGGHETIRPEDSGTSSMIARVILTGRQPKRGGSEVGGCRAIRTRL